MLNERLDLEGIGQQFNVTTIMNSWTRQSSYPIVRCTRIANGRIRLSQMPHPGLGSTRWKSHPIVVDSFSHDGWQTTGFHPWRHVSACMADTWNPDYGDSVFPAKQGWKQLLVRPQVREFPHAELYAVGSASIRPGRAGESCLCEDQCTAAITYLKLNT